jgi:hypothetical protein
VTYLRSHFVFLRHTVFRFYAEQLNARNRQGWMNELNCG